MVTIPTYCEINSALITYNQMMHRNHKQHQHDSPTSTTPIMNNLCFKYWLGNDMHKSHIRSTQHPQLKGCLRLGPSSILQWSFQRIVSFQFQKKKTNHSPCIVFLWFAPILSIIVNPTQNMTTLTKDKAKHGNNSNIFRKKMVY